MKKRMLVLALIFALACTTAACGDPAANPGISSVSTEQQQSEASVYAYNGYDFLNDAAKSNITTETVDVVTDMENAQGLFLTYFNANKLDLIGTNLLADDCKIKIEYNGTMYEAAGKENATAKLSEIQSLRADATIVDLHLNHSPNFVVNTAGNGGQTSYDTYTYFVDKKDSFTCETAITHMDAEYKYVDGSMKITAINWQYMESWKPVEYGSDVTEIPFEYTDVTIPDVDLAADDSNAEDFTDIQRIMSYFYENNMEDVEDFFADSETAIMDLGNLFEEPSVGKDNIEKTLDQILDMQEKNEGKYISLYYQMDPIITVSEDGNTAEGWFWSQTFEFKGKAFGNTVVQQIR